MHPADGAPGRLAEFDELFRTALRGQWRLFPTKLRWDLAGAAEAAVRELIARESACCQFTVEPAADGVRVDVRVPPAYVVVLDALAGRAAAGSGS